MRKDSNALDLKFLECRRGNVLQAHYGTEGAYKPAEKVDVQHFCKKRNEKFSEKYWEGDWLSIVDFTNEMEPAREWDNLDERKAFCREINVEIIETADGDLGVAHGDGKWRLLAIARHICGNFRMLSKIVLGLYGFWEFWM